MKILNLNFINFRNLNDNKINLSPNLNLFYGKNAQGKTSILEAIYFSSLGISFRTKKATEILQYQKNKFGTYMEFENEMGINSMSVKYQHSISAQKSFYINGKRKTQSDFFGNINIIVYVPEDIILINGGPKYRRNFFDLEISQYDKSYLEDLKNFNKIAKIRNKYLKEKLTKNEEYIVYNKSYIFHSAKIIKKRLEYIDLIAPILDKLYKNLFAGEQTLVLKYKTLNTLNKDMTIDEIEKNLIDNAKSFENNELKYGYSLIGPQKDDYIFILNHKEASISASQGEKKSIIFALKLAEIEIINSSKQEYPIVLIDDITSYFDEFRRKAVISFLEQHNIQVIISSTDNLDIKAKKFYIEKGDIYSDKNL